MKKYLYSLIALFGFYQANAQCSSCNYYIGGADPGGGAVLYAGGDLSPSNSKVCVTGDVTTSGFGNNANGWSVCVNNGVTWDAGGFNFMNGGTVDINGGTMNTNGFSGNGTKTINVGSAGTLNFSGNQIQGITVVNDGQFNLTADAQVSFNNSASVTNNGTMVQTGASSKLVINNATLTNNGTINLVSFENADATLVNGGPGNTSPTITISGDFFHHGGLSNYGVINPNTMNFGDKNFQNLNEGLIKVETTILFQPSNNAFVNNGGIEAGTSFTVQNSKDFAPSTGYIYAPSESGLNTPSILDGNTYYSDAVTLENSSFPVTIYELKASQIIDDIVLTWRVSDAENFNKFEIEKSVNAKNFERIGNLDWDNRKIPLLSFYDKSPNKGINYYRLKMLDNDGTYTYSKMVSLNYEEGKEYVYFENPSKGQSVLIKTNIEKPRIFIHDLLGREVSFKTITNSEGINIQPKKYVYDVLLITLISDTNRITKRAILGE